MNRLAEAHAQSGVPHRLTENALGNSGADQVGLSATASRRSFSLAAKSRMKKPPITQGARNIASWFPVNSWTTKVPLTEAMGRQTPRTPETRPRWETGTWSGRTATSAASSALKKTWAMHQPASTTWMFGASATTRIPREPPRRPMTIQGRRMPSGDDVRSLILPKNGFANIASRAPVPATSERLVGAWSIPTSEFTFNDRLTSRGARKSRIAPMYAAAYIETKPQPTRSLGRVSNVLPTAVSLRAGPGTCGTAHSSRPTASSGTPLGPYFAERRKVEGPS